MKLDAAVRALVVSWMVFAVRASAQAPPLPNEDGYDLWLRYHQISNPATLAEYRGAISSVVVESNSPTLRAARSELVAGLSGLLGRAVPTANRVASGAVVIGTPATSRTIAALPLVVDLKRLGREGFVIRATTIGSKRAIVVAANSDVGALYGSFHLLRQLQTNASLRNLSVASAPRIRMRVLDHWDNLDRS